MMATYPAVYHGAVLSWHEPTKSEKAGEVETPPPHAGRGQRAWQE